MPRYAYIFFCISYSVGHFPGLGRIQKVECQDFEGLFTFVRIPFNGIPSVRLYRCNRFPQSFALCGYRSLDHFQLFDESYTTGITPQMPLIQTLWIVNQAGTIPGHPSRQSLMLNYQN